MPAATLTRPASRVATTTTPPARQHAPIVRPDISHRAGLPDILYRALDPDRTEPLRVPMSLADYDRLEYGGKVEYVDGEAVFGVSPRYVHSNLTFEIGFMLKRAFPQLSFGAEPDTVIGKNIRQPDLVMMPFPKDPFGRLRQAPVLIVEVTSPSTAKEDRTRKADEYLALGVQQYWMANPAKRTITILRNDEGAWATIAELSADHPYARVKVGEYGEVNVDVNQLMPWDAR